MMLRKSLLPCSSPTAQHIIACTSLWLPNVTGGWLGQGCPDAAGKLMDTADGCKGLGNPQPVSDPGAILDPWESSAIPASDHDTAAESLMEDTQGVY